MDRGIRTAAAPARRATALLYGVIALAVLAGGGLYLARGVFLTPAAGTSGSSAVAVPADVAVAVSPAVVTIPPHRTAAGSSSASARTSSPGATGSPVPARLGLAEADRASLLWEIDPEAGTATANGKYTRSLAPFLGVTGVAPAGPGERSTIPPRTEAGGNIDCKELVASSILYLPVNTDGALLYLGDGHGAQGDGESCGTAIECGMTTEAVVSIARERPLRCVHAETPAGLVTFGFSADLNEAMGDALDAMVTWMAELYGTSRAEALALASTCVDLRVTQVANVTWGVHALLPAGLLS